MPTLNWIGKDKVVGLHNDVPFHVLKHGYGFTADAGILPPPAFRCITELQCLIACGEPHCCLLPGSDEHPVIIHPWIRVGKINHPVITRISVHVRLS